MGLRDTSARSKAALAEVSMLLAAFFVGTDVVSVKYALEGFPPLVLMPIRCTLAGLLLLASLRLLRRGIGLALRDLAALAGLGLVGVSLNQVGYTVGLSLTSGSNAALIFASAPVWGLLLGAVLGLERPTAGRTGKAAQSSRASGDGVRVAAVVTRELPAPGEARRHPT
jgi:drug/metabolite transporter (DMT)-like permease